MTDITAAKYSFINMVERGSEAIADQKISQAKTSRDPVAIEKVSAQFSSVLISQMVKTMFEGVGNDPMFGGGSAENIYRELMIDEYSKHLSQTDQLGFTSMVKRELLKLQEVNGG